MPSLQTLLLQVILLEQKTATVDDRLIASVVYEWSLLLNLLVGLTENLLSAGQLIGLSGVNYSFRIKTLFKYDWRESLLN